MLSTSPATNFPTSNITDAGFGNIADTGNPVTLSETGRYKLGLTL